MTSDVRACPERRRSARGSALIEALVAMLVLAAAGVAAARLQPRLHAGADSARLGAEALFLARLDLEQARGFASVSTPASAAAGATSYDAIASRSAAPVPASGGMTMFSLSRTVTADADPTMHAKTVSVRIEWADRFGGAQHVALDTMIAGADPLFGGALWLARSAPASLPVDGRAPSVPRGSKRLGDGTSLVALAEAGTAVLRVDDSDGALLAVCPGDVATRATVTPADLATCTPAHGRLLSGHVRFDDAASPDAGAADSAALPLNVRLTLTGGGDPASPPVCAAAIDATGHSVSYRCAVYTAVARGAWSGSSALVPLGWSIGPTPGQHAVCRESSDQDGSGAVDQNAEHPAIYTAVSDNLVEQNFLVVRGDVACPRGTSP